MVFKKLLAVLLAMVVFLGVFCALPAYATEGSIAKTIESVEIVYEPISSKLVYNHRGPDITGMMLAITFSDGSYEEFVVIREGNSYKAGGYEVFADFIFLTSMGNPANYGLKNIPVFVYDGENAIGDTYEILSIPSPIEFLYCIFNLLQRNAF